MADVTRTGYAFYERWASRRVWKLTLTPIQNVSAIEQPFNAYWSENVAALCAVSPSSDGALTLCFVPWPPPQRRIIISWEG
jgi:hypothetical protein